jgi:anaerobic selenocysteine-containing dehydrogenase
LAHGARIVQAQDVKEARAAVGDATRVALIWDGVDLTLGSSYAQAFADVTDLSTFITSEQSNARGAEAMGMLPGSGPGYAPFSAGLDANAMFARARAGELAVLSLFGVNPVRNAPDPVAVSEALCAARFVAVSELFMTETAACATLVLPAKGAFEKYGTTTNLAGDLLPINTALEAPQFVRSDFEMLRGLADQVDVEIPSPDGIDRAVVAHVAKSPPDFTFGDERFASTDKLRITRADGATKILSGGGTWLHDPWLAEMRAEVS